MAAAANIFCCRKEILREDIVLKERRVKHIAAIEFTRTVPALKNLITVSNTVSLVFSGTR